VEVAGSNPVPPTIEEAITAGVLKIGPSERTTFRGFFVVK
jgi:hypothetical protein